MRFIRKEEGNTFVLMALGMTMMVMALGLVVDGGHLYMTKSHMQKTANAAALSGAQELPNARVQMDQVVNEILDYHGESGHLLFSDIENDKMLHVGVGREVPLFFSSLFGIDGVMISAEAKASLVPMGAGKGAVPLGMDESMELNYGETYTLKVDSGDSGQGYFGILALDGPGAKAYGESLKYGFDEEIKVGDIINTQTGNIAGATRDGVKYRMNNCLNGNYQQRDCSRVMLIPVYKPYMPNGGQMKSVQITGFAYFYLTEPMNSTDDSIKGRFIKRAGAGTAETDAPLDRGAYTIKLTR